MLVTAWSKLHLFKIFPVKHACLLKEGSFCYILFEFHASACLSDEELPFFKWILEQNLSRKQSLYVLMGY